jgi:predicted Zn-dependent protease
MTHLQILRAVSSAMLTLFAVGAGPAWGARQPGAPLRPSGFNLFTREQDVQLGREASEEILKHHEVIRDPFLQNYLKRIGGRLAAAPEARESGFSFTFTVLNDAGVNAFALPGGPMFVYTGLLKAVDNEAQLAGAMAHEMSHVILRHGTNQLSKTNLLQIPALLAEEVTGSKLIGRLATAGITLGLNKYSRADESEADALGSHLMAEAGWEPLELGRFFEKLQGQAAGFLAFLTDHPDPGNRERAIGEEVRTLPRRTYGYETGQFARMKSEVRKVREPKVAPAPE